jgi:hypothetical protein
MLATYYLDGVRYSRSLVLLTIGMVVGAAMATAHNPEYSTLGFLTSIGTQHTHTHTLSLALSTVWYLTSRWCVSGATILSVGHTIAAATLMRRSGISVMCLMTVTSLPAGLALVPPFIMLELPALQDYIASNNPQLQFNMAVVAVCGVLVFVLVLFGLLLIKFTGAHYAAIISNLKVVLLVVIASTLFHSQMTVLNTIGLFIAFASFTAYTYVKNANSLPSAAPQTTLIVADSSSSVCIAIESKAAIKQ